MKRRIPRPHTRPRISVYRSNKFIYAQLIDDAQRTTLVSSDDTKSKEKGRIKRAEAVGADLAQKALAKKLKKVRFDKGAYKYHGRVKAVAEGARKAGLDF